MFGLQHFVCAKYLNVDIIEYLKKSNFSGRKRINLILSSRRLNQNFRILDVLNYLNRFVSTITRLKINSFERLVFLALPEVACRHFKFGKIKISPYSYDL